MRKGEREKTRRNRSIRFCDRAIGWKLELSSWELYSSIVKMIRCWRSCMLCNVDPLWVGRDESADVSEAHHQECARLEEQVDKEVVLSLEVEVVTRAEHEESSCPKLQEMHSAFTHRHAFSLGERCLFSEMLLVNVIWEGFPTRVWGVRHTFPTFSILWRGGCSPCAGECTSCRISQTCISVGFRVSQSRSTRWRFRCRAVRWWWPSFGAGTWHSRTGSRTRASGVICQEKWCQIVSMLMRQLVVVMQKKVGFSGGAYLGVVIAFRRVMVEGTYTAPQNGRSTSGTRTEAGMTMQ